MNSLEITLIGLIKIVLKELTESNKKGIKISKDVKITYEDLRTNLNKLKTHFSISGSISPDFGICEDCRYWNKKGHTSKYDSIGNCKLTPDKIVSNYCSCLKFLNEEVNK